MLNFKPHIRVFSRVENSSVYFGVLVFSVFLVCLSGCGGRDSDPLIQQANDEWVKGRNHSAIELFKAVLNEYGKGPQAEEALFRLGEIYHFSLSDSNQAIIYFQEVLQLNPDSPFSFDAQRYIAEIMEFTFKDLDQAIIEYQHLINDFNRPEENGEHQYRIASIYYKKQNYEQALVEYEALIEKFPDSAWAEEANYKLIENLYTLGRCSQIKAVYDQFLVNYPNSRFRTESDFVMASCLEEDGNLKEAYLQFKSLENRYPYPALLQMKLDGIEQRIKKKI